MVLNNKQKLIVQEIIKKVYSEELNENFLIEISPLIGKLLDTHYFAALLFPNRYTPNRLLISNNTPEFVNAYNEVSDNDFLTDTLIDTNSITVFNNIKNRDFPGKRIFLEETQKVRPVSDCCYVPLKINKSLAGIFAAAREGLNNKVLSKNEIEIFSFICEFLSEGFIRTLYLETNEEDTAYINKHGDVLASGCRIKKAFSDLFGRNFTNRSVSGDNIFSYLFNQQFSLFNLPGSGELTLTKNGRNYHFIFEQIRSPHYRPYIPDEAQYKVKLAKNNDLTGIEDVLDFQKLGESFELTDREKEVTECIYKGFSNKDISLKLKISEATAKRHIWNIFNKTGVESRTQLIFKLSLQ